MKQFFTKMFDFLTGFFREDSPSSSKRLLAIAIGTMLMWSIKFAIEAATTDKARDSIIWSQMVFILLILGIATLPQIMSLVSSVFGKKIETPDSPNPENKEQP